MSNYAHLENDTDIELGELAEPKDDQTKTFSKGRFQLYYPLIGVVWVISFVLIIFVMFNRLNSNISPLASDNDIELSILALNDCYELKPLSGLGGLARVATISNELKRHYGNAYLSILAGDTYSPSALGVAAVSSEDIFTLSPHKSLQKPLKPLTSVSPTTSLVDSSTSSTLSVKDSDDTPKPALRRLMGKQMVDIWNQIGIDYMTFGNHEFDLPKHEFMSRLEESRYTYIANNVHKFEVSKGEGSRLLHSNHKRYELIDRGGVKIMLVGIVIDSNKGDSNGGQKQYVEIDDLDSSIQTVRTDIQRWKRDGVEWDVLIAITHVNLEDDIRIIEAIPEVNLIIGGHEHNNFYLSRGSGRHESFITKADANARTVFIHKLLFNPALAHAPGVSRSGSAYNAPGSLRIVSELRLVDDTIPEDPKVAARVEQWWNIAADAFAKEGIDPNKSLVVLPDDVTFDARETTVRHRNSPIGQFIAEAYLNCVNSFFRSNWETKYRELPTHLFNADFDPSTPLTMDFAFFNSGSIRIDDVLKGALSEYDLLRLLPFGGKLRLANAKGRVVSAALSHGQSYPGNGSYIAYNPEKLRRDPKRPDVWSIYNPDTKQWNDIKPDRRYFFPVSDFMAAGGDGYFTYDSVSKELVDVELVDFRVFEENQLEALKSQFKLEYGVDDEETPRRDSEPLHGLGDVHSHRGGSTIPILSALPGLSHSSLFSHTPSHPPFQYLGKV